MRQRESIGSDEVNTVVNDFFKDKISIIKKKVEPSYYHQDQEKHGDPRLRTIGDAFFKPEVQPRRFYVL
jgi:hypothetical protein